MRKPPKHNGTLPLWQPTASWRAPNLAELPDWSRANRVAFDTEFKDATLRTLGCGARRGAKLAGYSFKLDGDSRAYYVPLRHPGGNNCPLDQGLAYARDNFARFKGRAVCANGSGDLDILDTTEGVKFDYNNVLIQDIQVAGPLIWELHHKYSLEAEAGRRGYKGKDTEALKAAAIAFGFDVIHTSGKRKGKEKSGWHACIPDLPSEHVGPYAEHDAAILLPVMDAQEKIIREKKLDRVWDLESRLLPVLLKIRQRGVLIDWDQLDRIEVWAAQEELQALAEIHRLTGINIGFGNCMKKGPCAMALLAIGAKLPKTDNGDWQITTAVLATITHPVAQLLRYCRQVNKLRTTFVASIRRYATNGRIHGTLRQIVGTNEKNEKSGAAFGRLSHCIAKGTLIEIVRDVSQHPKGVAIEDVKPGDLAYTYDDNLKLCLRKVQWAGKVGTKKVVRVHWRGYGGKHAGHIDLTPDHQVRMTSGAYLRADQLQPGYCVMALSRNVSENYGYARLWPTGANEIAREHRFIYEQLHGELSEHVHHDNHNKLDNRPDNLVGMTAAEHTALHAEEMDPTLRKKQGASLKARWLKEHDRLKAACSKPGDQAANWLGLTKEYLEDLLIKHDWSILRAFQASGHDFQTFKDYLIRHGFDLQAMKKKNLECRKAKGQHQYGKKKGNHQIIRVEVLDREVDVYDLTIEDTHNFIAGEICVHNCHPNTAQQPSMAKFAKMWRKIWLPEPGAIWGVNDLSQQEPRWTTHFATKMGCEGAADAAREYCNNPRVDNHDYMANLTGLERKWAKFVFLALCYGEGGKKLCQHQLKLPTRWRVTFGNYKTGTEERFFDTEQEAIYYRKNRVGKARITEVAGEEGQRILDTFSAKAPYIKQLSDLVMRKAEEHGCIHILGGRTLNFPLARDGSYDFTYKALNRLIQGTSGYQVKLWMLAVDREEPNAFIQMQRHDDIAGSFGSREEVKRVGRIGANVVKALVPFRIDTECGTSDGDIHQLCGNNDCVNDAVEDQPGKKFWCPEHMEAA